MVNIAPLEMVMVAVIALVVLGPARLPEVARSVGRGMREFRAAVSSVGDDSHSDEEDVDDEIPDVDDEVPDPDDEVLDPSELPERS